MRTINRNISIVPFHKGQESIWNNRNRYNIVPTGRRFGKTTFAEILVTMLASTFNKKLEYYFVGWFAPNYKYLKKSFQRIERTLKPLIKRSSLSNKEIQLYNNVTIDFWHLETGDAGNGERYNLVVIDEAGLCSNLMYQWRENIMPTLIDTKGKAWIIGTPKGINDYYELYEIVKDNKSWTTHKATSYDNPYLPRDELESIKQTLPEAIYKQEILGQFIYRSAENILIDGYKLEKCFVDLSKFKHVKKFYRKPKRVGFDIATDEGNDFNAITLFDSNFIMNILEYKKHSDAINYLKSNCQDSLIYYDSIGVGGNVKHSFDRSYKLFPFAFNNKIKGERIIYEGFTTNSQYFSNLGTQVWMYFKLLIEYTNLFLNGEIENPNPSKIILFNNKISPDIKNKFLKECSQVQLKLSDSSLKHSIDKYGDSNISPNLADSVIIGLSSFIPYGITNF